jgi:hypothetical protein
LCGDVERFNQIMKQPQHFVISSQWMRSPIVNVLGDLFLSR